MADTDAFLGQILAVAFNFVPRGWEACDGHLLSIAQNEALFSLLGTAYGGNGTTNFAVPDLRGRLAVCRGEGPGRSSYVVGQTGGAETVTLLSSQIGAHGHQLLASNYPGGYWPPPPYPAPPDFPPTPGPGMALAVSTQPAVPVYGTNVPYVALSPASITAAAGKQYPHENRQPFLSINYIMCSDGPFPSRT
jgi:microcystin-dependent protein